MAVLLQACLNGGRSKWDHPAVPETPEELARDAAAVRAAGAGALHLHPRDASGAETLEPGQVAAALEAVRRAVPGMPVGIGTGHWIAPGGRARHADIRGWTVLPNYASVNLKEEDAIEVMRLLEGMGVGIEAGLWSEEDAIRFVERADPSGVTRILIEMTSDDPAAARAEADRTLAVLAAAGVDRPMLLHGEGGSMWAMIRRAAELGLSTRVGFEDGFDLPDGSRAASNADEVAAAARILTHEGAFRFTACRGGRARGWT